MVTKKRQHDNYIDGLYSDGCPPEGSLPHRYVGTAPPALVEETGGRSP